MNKLWIFCTVMLMWPLGMFSASAAQDYTPESGSKAERKKASWAVKADPELPNVLILGDSISIGYTLQVRKALKGKANVFRPCAPNGKRPENCQGTRVGVQRIDRWLAGQKWDVIHFNWGLHDLKHWKVTENKNSDSYEDPRQSEPEEYRENLTEIVEKLKATGATLIFATTTPYPEGVSPARLPADAALYNDIALEIMNAKGIQVNDLYALMEGRLEEFQKPENVHFNTAGSEVLAEKVARVLHAALADASATESH